MKHMYTHHAPSTHRLLAGARLHSPARRVDSLGVDFCELSRDAILVIVLHAIWSDATLATVDRLVDSSTTVSDAVRYYEDRVDATKRLVTNLATQLEKEPTPEKLTELKRSVPENQVSMIDSHTWRGRNNDQPYDIVLGVLMFHPLQGNLV